ncbi:hypothetical protein OROHE_024179 [Orobanche hederae]
MGGVISTVVLVAEGVAALATGGFAGVTAWATTKLAGFGMKMLTGAAVSGSVSAMGMEKMMKAPGQDFMIPREVFEADPAAWFRSHR